MNTSHTQISEKSAGSYQPSKRKLAIRDLADLLAPERDRWIARNKFFHEEDFRYLKFLIAEGSRVLDLGCGTGRTLAALNPSRGVGIDFSPRMIDIGRKTYPNIEFYIGDVENPDALAGIQGPFDYILLSDTIGSLDDCQSTLESLHHLCSSDTRVVVSYYSRMWEPILTTARLLRLQMPSVQQNWLSSEDIENLLQLADYEVVKREWRQLLPRRMLGLGWLVNRLIAPFPVIRRACLRNYVIARPIRKRAHTHLSATVLIPCRNERGNIESAVRRIPRFCNDIEILFVEGHSQDGTLDEIHRVIAAYPELDIKVAVQDGKGKGDAVRKGFDLASGQLLMILDADLTMPPEALSKFYIALIQGKGEFINGTRLVYPMEQDAMRVLNWIANQAFSWMFTWLLNQRFTDTLCGTKVLTKLHYQRIAANRSYFGDFDPFGDFDLIFGAVKQNLKVVEIPITYASRSYGETQISRFRHGLLLLRMVMFAFRKLKAF